MKTCEDCVFCVDKQCHRLPPKEHVVPLEENRWDIAVWK